MIRCNCEHATEQITKINNHFNSKQNVIFLCVGEYTTNYISLQLAFFHSKKLILRIDIFITSISSRKATLFFRNF